MLSKNRKKVSSTVVGRILNIKDNIISVSGLRGAFSGELVYFRKKNGTISGFILNLEKNICRVILLSEDKKKLKIGDSVYITKAVVNTNYVYNGKRYSRAFSTDSKRQSYYQKIASHYYKLEKEERQDFFAALFILLFILVYCIYGMY